MPAPSALIHSCDDSAPHSGPTPLPAAPSLPDHEGDQGFITHLLPLTGALGSVAMVIGAGQGGNGSRGLIMAAAVVSSSLLLVLAQVLRQRSQRRRAVERARLDHLAALDAISESLRTEEAAARTRLQRQWPALTAGTGPRPEPGRRPGRIRIGELVTGTDLEVTTTASTGVADPVCTTVLARFAQAHQRGLGTPVALDLEATSQVEFHGPAREAEAAQRALVLQACLAADGRPVAVLAPLDDLARWDWVKWLPHTQMPGSGARGRLVDHRAARLLARLPQRPVLLVVAPGAEQRLSTHDLPEGSTLVVTVPKTSPGELTLRATGRSEMSVGGEALAGSLALDRLDLASATAIARTVAQSVPQANELAPQDPFRELLAGTRPEVAGPGLMRAAIGHTPQGELVHLDLRESSQGGHGPHGLVVGATGSGKSELLRSLVVGLAATHSVDDLALVLVDFKGGATFLEIDTLPHVAACVTNLAEDVSLVERMQDALTGELERRQELLHAHGHPDIGSYRAAREGGAALPALPHLLLCVDEFSELLAARPDFLTLFTAVGRLGRSLGIHLLLASQRLDEGRLQALEAHLSFRIALRTFSALESRAAIGTPDAYALPRLPGAALMRTGAGEPLRVQALHLGAPRCPARAEARAKVETFTVLPVRRDRPTFDRNPSAPETTSTIGDALLAHARCAAGGPTHRIWLPPLDGPLLLGDLVGPLSRTDAHGLHAPTLRTAGGLRLPLGAVDVPRRQRHDVHELDLTGAGGHVAIVGAPRSGRSTTLATLVGALALGLTPTECEMHLVDLGDAALRPLADLPHVASYSTRRDGVLLRRVMTDLVRTVAEREVAPPGTVFPAIILAVDGWGTLRQEFEDEEATLARLAARALAVGVHVLTTSHRWADFRPALLDVIGSRVELKLGDPFESLVDRRRAADVPADRPGRGLAPSGLSLLVAATALVPGSDVSALAAGIDRAWSGPRPRRLRALPTTLRAADLSVVPRGQVGLGLDVAGETVLSDVGRHLVVEGPDGSGRSTVLARQLTELGRQAPDAQVLVLDPRARLRGLVSEAQLLGHAVDPREATSLLEGLADALKRRSRTDGPGESVGGGASALRPDVRVVIDDVELLRSTGVDLSCLIPLLPTAADIGLTVCVAGRSQGLHASDRLLSLLCDLGADRLVLTGRPAGRGVLHGADGHALDLQLAPPAVQDVSPDARVSAGG